MEEKQWWTFTFGWGQKHENMYVRIYGTFDTTREIMFEKYGSEWSGQYNEAQWKDWEDRRPPWIHETLLEEIGE